MLSVGLLFVLCNILEMVSTTRQRCPITIGTYPKQGAVLNPLAKLIEEKVQGASYACALEPRAYLKFFHLTDEQWQKLYSNVKIAKELKYEAEKDGGKLKKPEELAKEAFDHWSPELEKIKGGRFGCVIQNQPSMRRSFKTVYKLACLFE
ncbi:hypothetical protein ANCCAN_03219 [Ancylostoma caninum]|uniref:SCP domain-containing protein n=1 Tax=Ancylostoma caninum TaxID=29170 RepID=A0A368H1W8_ANCCA|nr:hypothetical protein ANCCAN_03219 [Ancylostoma caninum]